MAEIDEEVFFGIDFHCTSDPDSSMTHQTLTFSSTFPPPTTVGDVTRKIEEIFHIPETQTKVEYNSIVVDRATKLSNLKVRNGDSFLVHYYSVADCREVTGCVEWMNYLLDILKKWRRQDNTSIDIDSIRGEKCLELLSFNYFSPWMIPKKYANKIYFISKDGLVLVCEIMNILLDIHCSCLPKKLLEIESAVLGLLWNITEDEYIIRAVIQSGGIRTCTKALLRITVTPFVELTQPNCVNAKETIRKSLGTLANLCELPDIRMDIAMNKEAVQQMLAISLCPTFEDTVIHRVVMILLDLSYTRETHPHIILNNDFAHFMESECTYVGTFTSSFTHLLLPYHKAVLFAILLSESPQYFNNTEKHFVCKMLDTFLKGTNYLILSHYETERGIFWGTIAPLVKSLYLMETTETNNFYIHPCKLTILLALLTLLSREYHQNVLIKEGMVDFVICLPWYSTGEICERAKEVVTMIRRAPDIQYQPPSLLNISKAAVAVYYCGLDDVMRLTVPELAGKLQFS